MKKGITIEQAIRFGIRYGFALYPDDEQRTGRILNFSRKMYSKLLRDGWLAGDYWLRELWNSDPLRDGICLVYNEEAQHDLTDYKPPKSIDPLLKRIHLAGYASAPEPTVRLISKSPLFEILPKHWEKIKRKGLRGLKPLVPYRLGLKDIYIKSFLRLTTHFSGRTYACTCGEPGCASDFAWVEDSTPLLYIYSGSGLLVRVWFLPFI